MADGVDSVDGGNGADRGNGADGGDGDGPQPHKARNDGRQASKAHNDGQAAAAEHYAKDPRAPRPLTLYAESEAFRKGWEHHESQMHKDRLAGVGPVSPQSRPARPAGPSRASGRVAGVLLLIAAALAGVTAALDGNLGGKVFMELFAAVVGVVGIVLLLPRPKRRT